MIYVWHKENGMLIEELKGHASCVNAVAWNPCNPGMFASAGDDRYVRMYGLLFILRKMNKLIVFPDGPIRSRQMTLYLHLTDGHSQVTATPGRAR